MERTISLAGDPNIGVFARVFEEIAVIPPGSPEQFQDALTEGLGLELVETTIQGSSIIGSLLAGNRHGFVVSGLATEEEIARLSGYREVMLLEDGMNAAGNVILTNDSFAVVHPGMRRETASEIGALLRVPVARLTFAGIKTVGMAAVATNRGVLVHPRTTDKELGELEKITELPIGTGTVNLGSGLVGSGLLVNTRGYLAGGETSGFELGRVEDVFGFVE
jgi:translation initiation factor 6